MDDMPSFKEPGQRRSDGFVKSPHAALCCILCHCSVRQARFIPQDLHALPANILRSRQKWCEVMSSPADRQHAIQDDRRTKDTVL
jgi:hypothetical protein